MTKKVYPFIFPYYEHTKFAIDDNVGDISFHSIDSNGEQQVKRRVPHCDQRRFGVNFWMDVIHKSNREPQNIGKQLW